MPPVKELLCSPPALFLLPALIHLASGLYFSTFFTAPWWYPAPLLITAGAIFGLSAMLKFHKSRISPLPWQNNRTRLFTDGIYGISRNPMYVSLILLLTGCGLLSSAYLIPLTLPLFAGCIHMIIIKEERNNLQNFGDEYLEYCRRTRRWL